jgi:hypothetical protein
MNWKFQFACGIENVGKGQLLMMLDPDTIFSNTCWLSWDEGTGGAPSLPWATMLQSPL